MTGNIFEPHMSWRWVYIRQDYFTRFIIYLKDEGHKMPVISYASALTGCCFCFRLALSGACRKVSQNDALKKKSAYILHNILLDAANYSCLYHSAHSAISSSVAAAATPVRQSRRHMLPPLPACFYISYCFCRLLWACDIIGHRLHADELLISANRRFDFDGHLCFKARWRFYFMASPRK